MNTEPTIQGIRCDVQNCIYNNGACCCTAHQVEIASRPRHPEESLCKTFTEATQNT